MRWSVLIPLALSLCLNACVSVERPSDVSALERDLDEMLAWFPGVYDNFEQIESERETGLDDAVRHRHLNHTFFPVDIEGIPGRLLYAQQYQHHNPADLYRQRVYSFQTDFEENAIRLTIYTPKTPEDLVDLHLDPTRQNALSENDFILKPGCEVYWNRDETQFDGYLKLKSCSYYSTRYETEIFLEETLTLRPDALLLNDRGVDKDGNVMFGVGDKGPTINLKQTAFSELDTELQRIARLLSGDYFSDAAYGARQGRPIYLRIRNITPPIGRRHAMYAEMRHDGPDGEFYRQLIYLFDESPDRTQTRMQAYPVVDQALAATLIQDPTGFANGTVEASPPLSDACYTEWKAIERGFASWIDPDRCVITGKRGDQRRIEARTEITNQSIGQLERGFSLEGQLLFGNPDGELYVWPRVARQDED